MLRAAGWALLLLACATPAQARMERAYIGTFTNPGPGRQGQFGNRGEGIYVVEVDDRTGKTTTPRLVARGLSPSWLAIDRVRGVLYAANSGNGATGAVTAYRIDRASGDLARINQVTLPDSPVHIALDTTRNWLLAASYNVGSLAVLPVHADGSLGEPSDVLKPQGPSHPEQAADTTAGNQYFALHDHSRMHGVAIHPGGRYVAVNDAGLDMIGIYTIGAGGKLNLVGSHSQIPGSAPRHSLFDAAGRTLYTVLEQNSKLVVSTFDPATGALAERQVLSTLPPGYAGSGAAAELHFSRDGRTLYVSNRFHNSIAWFRVRPDGTLTYGGDAPMAATFLRSFAVDPSGKFLLGLSQYGDNIAVYRLGRDGVPATLNLYAPVPSPVAMAFVDD